MSAVSTKREDVEALASKFDGTPNDYRWERDHHAAAATLRALLAERDALQAIKEALEIGVDEAQAERDAARAALQTAAAEQWHAGFLAGMSKAHRVKDLPQ